jgi:hypothetical protein
LCYTLDTQSGVPSSMTVVPRILPSLLSQPFSHWTLSSNKKFSHVTWENLTRLGNLIFTLHLCEVQLTWSTFSEVLRQNAKGTVWGKSLERLDLSIWLSAMLFIFSSASDFFSLYKTSHKFSKIKRTSTSKTSLNVCCKFKMMMLSHISFDFCWWFDIP